MDDILFQLDLCWNLFLHYMDGVTDEEAIWCKGDRGLSVKYIDGKFIADLNDSDDYSIGPSSIAWNLWHIKYTWSNVINACFKDGDILKDDIFYSGSVETMISELNSLHDEWIKYIKNLSNAELQSIKLCRWPFNDKSFFSLTLWVNNELMKDVSEISVGRYLYGIEKNSG